MIFSFSKSIVFFLLLLATPVLYGQVLVKMSADKDRILVGETVNLTIEVRFPLGEKFKWVTLDTIPHFEWINKGPQQSSDGIDGKKVQQAVSVTSYDTGYWIIPRLSIKVGAKTYATDTLGIKVSYSPNFNPEENYRDIKEMEDVQVASDKTMQWWIIGGAALLLILLLLFFSRKKTTKQKPENKTALSPFEEAIQALALLRTQYKADDGEVKLYYTRINDILRNFVAKQFRLSTFEKTNDELILQLRQLNLPTDQFTSLAQALRMADFVKFARYLPPATENEKAIAIVESAITSLNKSTQ